MDAVYFDSDDDAVDLVDALETAGYTTTLRREAFAGEEDWDDRAWVLVVELVDRHGGWLVGDDRPAVAPPALPTQPRRRHRP
jgi:hypothetical protein